VLHNSQTLFHTTGHSEYWQSLRANQLGTVSYTDIRGNCECDNRAVNWTRLLTFQGSL